MDSRLPAPIGERDLLRYRELLSLSTAQQQFLAAAHARYARAVSGMLSQQLPELDALNDRACEVTERHMADGVTYARVRATDEFYDKSDAMLAQIVRVDDSLLTELDSVLAEAQREQLRRVCNHRQRQRCTSFAYRVIRSSWIDLSALAEEILANREVLASIDPILREYEAALTPMTVALERELRSQDRTLPALLAWRERDEQDQRLAADEHIRRSIESMHRQAALVAEGASLQHAIADLNARTLPLLLEQLPPDCAAVIAERCRRTSFPVVYPDRYESGFSLCERAAASAELTEAQREAIAAMCEVYRSSYQATCAQMEQRCMEWQAFYARTRFTMDKYEPYRQDMRALREKRWRLGLSLAGQVQSLVPQGTVAEINDLARNMQGQLEHGIRESQTPNDGYPGL